MRLKNIIIILIVLILLEVFNSELGIFNSKKDIDKLNVNQTLPELKEKYDIDLPPKLAKLILKLNGEGIVYFIRLKQNNLIKIGSTIDCFGRLKSLNNEHNGIVPILLLKTQFYRTFERFFHDLFNKFLKDKDEYFEIPEEYLIEVPKIKSFLGKKI